MRIVLPVFAVALFAAPALAVKPTPEAPDALAGAPIVAEENTYRFGYPYRSERGTTVDACALACNRDASCAAWSLTPATFKIGPRCELKRAPGAASYRKSQYDQSVIAARSRKDSRRLCGSLSLCAAVSPENGNLFPPRSLVWCALALVLTRTWLSRFVASLISSAVS